MTKKLRHGEGSVSPYTLADGTERYRARWWEEGRLRSRSFAEKEDAQRFLIEMSGDRRLGRYTPVSVMTVKQAVESYLRRNAERWSTNTVASYRQVAQSHVYPHIGNERIAGLTTSRVQAWIDLLKRKTFRKKLLAPSTIINAHIILRGACADLVRMDELPRNPAVGVRLPTRKRSEKTVWTETQVSDVIKHARELYPQMETYYRVALTTGLRPGEIRALMWKDIDFDAGVITCSRSITRDERFRHKVGSTTKTSKARTIAVPSSTIESLRTLRQAQRLAQIASPHGAWNDTGIVFERGDGVFVSQQSIWNRHRKICEAAKVPAIRMHDLRHTFAVLMLKAGVNIKVVSEMLGHASITTTADIYLHVSVDMQRSASDLIGEIVG